MEVGTFVAVARHLNGNAYECRLASCTFTTAEATALSPPASVKGVLGFLAPLIALSQIGILLVVIWGRWFRRDHTPDIGAPGVVLGGFAFGFLGMLLGRPFWLCSSLYYRLGASRLSLISGVARVVSRRSEKCCAEIDAAQSDKRPSAKCFGNLLSQLATSSGGIQ